MNRFHWHHSLTPLSHQNHIDKLKKVHNFYSCWQFSKLCKHKPWQRGNEWNSSWQVSHFSPWMLALQLHFPSLSHCSVNDPSALQTQAKNGICQIMYNLGQYIWNHLLSQGGRFGQGWLWDSVSFFSEHILLLVLVALPQVAEQVLQSDQSPDDSPVTNFQK